MLKLIIFRNTIAFDVNKFPVPMMPKTIDTRNHARLLSVFDSLLQNKQPAASNDNISTIYKYINILEGTNSNCSSNTTLRSIETLAKKHVSMLNLCKKSIESTWTKTKRGSIQEKKVSKAIKETNEEKQYRLIVKKYKQAQAESPKKAPKVNYTKLLSAVKSKINELSNTKEWEEKIRKSRRDSFRNNIWDSKGIFKKAQELFETEDSPLYNPFSLKGIDEEDSVKIREDIKKQIKGKVPDNKLVHKKIECASCKKMKKALHLQMTDCILGPGKFAKE